MKVLKSINNNIVSAYDQNGQEIVVMGKGIGFKAKEGCDIPDQMIEKIFRMDSQNATDKLKELLSGLPLEHIQVSSDIITYAKKILGRRLNQSIYITLTDHISFAVYRFQQGMNFQNALLLEVRRFYYQEYLVGEYALDLIEKSLHIRLPDDEAASIALHLVNAEYDSSLSAAMNTPKLIRSILLIVKEAMTIELDERTLYCERFITHLKFLAQRIFKKELLSKNDRAFAQMVSTLYPQEFACSLKIAQHIQAQYDYSLQEEELAYLTIHIKRVCASEDETI